MVAGDVTECTLAPLKSHMHMSVMGRAGLFRGDAGLVVCFLSALLTSPQTSWGEELQSRSSPCRALFSRFAENIVRVLLRVALTGTLHALAPRSTAAQSWVVAGPLGCGVVSGARQGHRRGGAPRFGAPPPPSDASRRCSSSSSPWTRGRGWSTWSPWRAARSPPPTRSPPWAPRFRGEGGDLSESFAAPAGRSTSGWLLRAPPPRG